MVELGKIDEIVNVKIVKIVKIIKIVKVVKIANIVKVVNYASYTSYGKSSNSIWLPPFSFINLGLFGSNHVLRDPPYSQFRPPLLRKIKLRI